MFTQMTPNVILNLTMYIDQRASGVASRRDHFDAPGDESSYCTALSARYVSPTGFLCDWPVGVDLCRID